MPRARVAIHPADPLPPLREMGSVASGVAIAVGVHADGWYSACPDAERLAERAALTALASAAPEAAAHFLLGVVLTDDAEQRVLNRTYRGHDKPTNVLAFPLALPMPAPVSVGAPVMLGDVVLACETVLREAAEQQKPAADHLAHLVVHGVLHLLGFDHENDTDAAIMEAREVAILQSLGVPDPYRAIM